MLVKDGEFFPETPGHMRDFGNHKKDFNMIISTVQDDGTFCLFAFPHDPRFSRFNPAPITKAQSQEVLKSLIKPYFAPYPEEQVNQVYYAGLNNSDAYRRTIPEAYGDWLISCPTFHFAKTMFRNSLNTIKVYQVKSTQLINFGFNIGFITI